MRRTYILEGGKVVPRDDEGAPILVFVNPDVEERRRLIEEFNIDEHTLGSVLDPDEVGRVEFEPDHVAIVFKRPKSYSASDNFLFKVTTVGLFLFQNRIVILTMEDDNFFEGRYFVRMNSLSDLLLRMLYRNIVHFTDHLRVMSLISDDLEKKINTAMENRHLLHMFTLMKSLVYYLNAISSNRRVLEKLRNSAHRLEFAEEALEYLEDVLIENAQCFEQATTYSQVLASLMDARASLVSNNLNVMMKNLNAMVIAVAIPSFVAAAGGMSEFSMMTGTDSWMIAYPLFFLSMAALGVFTFYIIKKLERFWH